MPLNTHTQEPTMYYAPTSHTRFIQSLHAAQTLSDTVRAATTPAADLSLQAGDRAYLSPTETSGFVVRQGGELCAVFSLVRGRGDGIVASALRRGATHLDHFDVEPLNVLYTRFGFVETRREPNWTVGGPHVVFRSRLAHG